MKISVGAIALLAIGLAACQSFDPAALEPGPAPPRAATPVTLTTAQTDQVKAAIKASLGNSRSLTFGDTFVAGANAAGEISVCGTVSGRGIPGGPGDKPFVGHFFNGRFIPDKIGGGQARSQDTVALCTSRGLSLPFTLPPPAAPPAPAPTSG